MSLYKAFQPLLFRLEPETAHAMALKAIASGIGAPGAVADPRLAVEAMGLSFPNPIGLAPGFDKDARAFRGAPGFGFGFVEIGTVTPLPQAGNPKPRVFRLEDDQALINRLGFNNEGFDAAAARLAGRGPGIVGANVGANKESEDRIADYAAGVARFAPLADYITINISSPNTPGLRDLQAADSLAALLEPVVEARNAATRRVPLLVKIAPDVDGADLTRIVETVIAHDIEGMIVSNTTLARHDLTSPRANEAGGLSGRPLFARSTAMLARVRHIAGDRLTLIGVGGVESADTAWEKLAAGADLVQFYTAMVYEGFDLAARIARGLAERLDRESIAHISDVTGTANKRWREAPID